MYGYGEKKFFLEPEEILKRVSEEEIFKLIIREDIILDKGVLYRAPYRTDHIASCWFERYEEVLYFVDFADVGQKSKNCFSFISRVYNLSFIDTLQLISNEFKLGLGDNLKKVEKVVNKNDYFLEEKKIKKTFKERVITIVPRAFNYKDKQFWEKYNISRDNLLEDKVFPLELYRSTNKFGEIFTIRPHDICYAYTDFPNGKKKIYRPHALSKAKWFTNCNQNDIGSLSSLSKKGKLLIVTKSYKDCRVLRNLGFNVIWFQNEGMLPSADIIKDFCKRFEKIVIWFDNDRAGISNSRIVKDYINSIDPNKASTIMLPPKVLFEGIKDPSDVVAIRGLDSLVSFLEKKNLQK